MPSSAPSSRTCERPGRIVEFGDAERHRIERNLHDGAQQPLVNLVLALGIARSLVGTAQADALGTVLDDAAAELSRALADLRDLARGLHPLILSEAGLGRRSPRWRSVPRFR